MRDVTMQAITINFDDIRDIAHKGVRRAAVFLGLGLNAAYDSALKEYRLSKISQIDLEPPNADDKTIALYKDEFSFRIIGNGLRELVETFNIFLDRLYEGCSLLSFSKNICSRRELSDKCKKFHFEGLKAKLTILKHEFAIDSEQSEQLISINQARNCLTHRQGIVGQQDLAEDSSLRLKWTGIEVFIQTPSGDQIPLIPMPGEAIVLKDGGKAMLRFVDRSRVFDLGARIILSPRDLSEICQVFSQAANSLTNGGMEYSQKLGIPNMAAPSA